MNNYIENKDKKTFVQANSEEMEKRKEIYDRLLSK